MCEKVADYMRNLLSFFGHNLIVISVYILFLASLALEWKVNMSRTLMLLPILGLLSQKKYLRSSLLESTQLKLAALYPLIALCSWLLGPYGEGGLKTFDWIMYLVIGYVVAYEYQNKAIFILLIIPFTCLLASFGSIIWHWIVDGNIAALFQIDLKMKIYNDSANRMGFLLAIAASLIIGILPLINRYRAFLFLSLGAIIILCWYTQSRSAFFSLVGMSGIAFLFFLRKDVKQGLILASLLGALLLVFFFFIGGVRIPQTISHASWDFLLNGRGDIWQAAWEIFQKSPLFGFGVDSFRQTLEVHLLLPENASRFPDIRSQYIFWNAHQMVLGILSETGLAGLLVFLLLIFKGLKEGICKYPLAFAPFLMLVTFLVAGLGGYGFHRSWNAAFFFFSLGLLDGLSAKGTPDKATMPPASTTTK